MQILLPKGGDGWRKLSEIASQIQQPYLKDLHIKKLTPVHWESGKEVCGKKMIATVGLSFSESGGGR
jgi:hypothetical protein